MSKMRLQKAIAQTGVASRRAAEKLIVEGKVTVNGIVVTKLGTTVDPTKDKIAVEDTPLRTRPKKILIALYKPRGVLSTCKDPEGRKTILDCIPPQMRYGLYPIGRLDRDSEGLILLTNDGDLALKLSHPRYEKTKTYIVKVQGNVTNDALHMLEKGVTLDGKKTAPCTIKKIASKENAEKSVTELAFILHEGRKRQIRRMCEMMNAPVVYLCRTKIGNITLENLKPGQHRIIK